MRTPLDRKGSGRVGSIVSHREKDRGSKTARASSAAVSPAVVSPESAAVEFARLMGETPFCYCFSDGALWDALSRLRVSVGLCPLRPLAPPEISPRKGAARR